jgi:hypothetical protein
MPGDCLLVPQQAIDFASRDINRLVGSITLLLMRRAPYADVLEGGTFENGISDQQRNVVIERPVLGQSLVMPEFDADLSTCGTLGEVAEVGSTEYVTQLGTLRGRGPKVCVKQMRSAFQNSYAAVQDGLQKQLLYLANVDVRSTLLMRSGVKAKTNLNRTFEQMINGDVQQIDVSFVDSVVPDAPCTMEFLQYLVAWAHEDLLAEPFESERGAVAKFIGSQPQLNFLRAEVGIHQDFQYLTTGRYDIGEETITGYTWEGPYLGIALGIDQQPLRFNNFTTINGQLVPNLIEPEIAVAVTNGYASRANPAYRLAQFEIGFIVFANSFRRLVPEQYLGVADWRFPAQFTQGELEFVVLRDNDCNIWGDFGYHIYQMIRAYRPERPHAVIPIAYKRAFPTFNFSAQTSYPGTSTLFSL